MSYLRTRTNIYEMVAEFDKTYLVKCRTKSKEGKDRLLSKSEVEKRANTIEELCDGYEICRVDDDWCWYCDKSRFNEPIKVWQITIDEYEWCKEENEEITVKGYIRTSKGLIYVAKMNDKGKLELI